ncbi:hypothetical protein [Streptomyces sp. NPDC059256]|uniref:hypothetical protein n=1 Tax=Streptomyces sp. NPDC059256 TaxID=3346794 RepID=UPI003686A712
MIDRLLLLYPSGYRAAYGSEIADTYREMTRGAPRGARLREGLDLAAHAVRVRFQLRSADPLGRFLASAAPFALAAAAVSAASQLLRWCTSIVVSPTPWMLSIRTLDHVGALSLLFSLLVCIGAMVALTGRWAVGVAAAVCGLCGTAGLALSVEWLFGDRVIVPLAALLTVAVVLACPADLRPDGSASAAAGAMAWAAWLPAAVVETRIVQGVSTHYGAWPLLALTMTGVVLALRAKSSGVCTLGAMAVASPPFIAHAYVMAWHDLRPVAAMVLVFPAAVVITATVARARRSP